MTFAELKQVLFDRLGGQEFTPLASTVTTVERIVNEAANKVASSQKWYWLEDAQKTIAMVDGTVSYSLDVSIADIVELINGLGDPMSEVARDTFEDLYRGDSTQAANPTRFTVDGMQGSTRKIDITVWPEPTGDSTVKIRGYRRIAEMTGDTDVPEIPDELHHLIVDQAIALLREFEESPMAELAFLKASQGLGTVPDSEGDKTT